MIRRFALALLLLVSLVSFAAPQMAFAADSKTTACQTIGDINPEGGNCANPGGSNVKKLITVAVNMLSGIAGVIALIMIIISGLMFVTSEGDPTKAANARKALIYAIVGIVVVAFSQVIVRFALSNTA